jgi:hypothetical protein
LSIIPSRGTAHPPKRVKNGGFSNLFQKVMDRPHKNGGQCELCCFGKSIFKGKESYYPYVKEGSGVGRWRLDKGSWRLGGEEDFIFPLKTWSSPA